MIADSHYRFRESEKKRGKRLWDFLTKKNPQKRAKIPDVAYDLGADCIGLYEMMRALHFKL